MHLGGDWGIGRSSLDEDFAFPSDSVLAGVELFFFLVTGIVL